MKKYFLFAIVALLLLTGCGKKQVVCSATEEEGGVKVTESIIGDLDSSDKITKVSMEMEYPDTDTAKTNCESAKSVFGDKVSCSGKKIVIDDATAFLGDQDTIVGLTKDEFITLFTSTNEAEVTCK